MSYVSKQFLIYDNSSSANFRAWAGAIDVAILAGGWVLTSDSGQTDPSTAAVPGSGASIYRIYKPADALQTGASQIFLKVNYGTNASSPAGPTLTTAIGSGTDGAGNLTGLVTATNTFGASFGIGGGSVTSDCYFSIDVDRISMLLWRSQGNKYILTVERTKNADGTNNADGVIIFNGSAANGSIHVDGVIFTFAVIAWGRDCGYCGSSGTYGGIVFNNNVAVGSLTPCYGKFTPPLLGIALTYVSSVPEGAVFQSTLYGSTRTYILVTGIGASNPVGSTGSIGVRFD